MAVNYNWNIFGIEKTASNGNLTEIITQVRWVRVGTDDVDNISGSFAGSTRFSLNEVDPGTFVPYAALSKDQVVAWLENKEVSNLEMMNTRIQEDIERSRNVSVVQKADLPWEVQN
ncbi:MAG: hypothetical protein EBU90_24770 [Proteobacteria bacterium]|nr:hypothetical protein [Pseudomonadota bacterium]